MYTAVPMPSGTEITDRDAHFDDRAHDGVQDPALVQRGRRATPDMSWVKKLTWMMACQPLMKM